MHGKMAVEKTNKEQMQNNWGICGFISGKFFQFHYIFSGFCATAFG